MQMALIHVNTPQYNRLRKKLIFKPKDKHTNSGGDTNQDNASAFGGLANAISNCSIGYYAQDTNRFFHSVSADQPPLPVDNKLIVSDIPDTYIRYQYKK